MKKLLLATMMMLGLAAGMGSAYAATTSTQFNHPQVTHWGSDYAADAGGDA